MTKELEIVDHITDGEENILYQYRKSPVFKAFIESFLREINELEAQAFLFLTETSLQTADGAQLNGIGRILNSKTRPPNDDLFRALLNALAAAYNSNGTAQDVKAVIMLTVSAEDVFIDETPAEGQFTVTIFGPDFTFGQQVVFDVVNLTKSAGIEFISFIISDSFSDPTFSFVGDNRPNSEGYAVAVPISVPDSFYLGYVFPLPASITTANRVFLTSVSGDPKQDLVVNIITSNANLTWNAELLLSFAVIGGTFEFTNKDTAQNKIRLIVLDAVNVYTMTVIGNYQQHSFAVVSSGQTKSAVQINSTIVTPEILNAEFVAYTEADAALWTTNNPSGLGKTFIEDSSGFPDIYATSGGGRYSVLIS